MKNKFLLMLICYLTAIASGFALGRSYERAHAPKPLPVPTSATIATFDGKGNMTSQRLFVCTQTGTATTTLDHVTIWQKQPN